MPKNRKRQDLLADLLTIASQEILSDLVIQVTSLRPDVRRECLEYMKKHEGRMDELRAFLAGHARESGDRERYLALAVLIKCGYPTYEWDGKYEFKAAKKLEVRFPEEILGYYISGLGNLGANAVRKEYARKAKIM